VRRWFLSHFIRLFTHNNSRYFNNDPVPKTINNRLLWWGCSGFWNMVREGVLLKHTGSVYRIYTARAIATNTQALQLMDSTQQIKYQKLMISNILPTFTSLITLPMLLPSWPKCVAQLAVAQLDCRPVVCRPVGLSPRWPYTEQLACTTEHFGFYFNNALFMIMIIMITCAP